MRRLFTFLITLSCAALLSAQAPSPPRDSTSMRPALAPESAMGRLAGRVISADTGEPLRNARVTLSPAAGDVPLFLSDGDGRFAFTSLPPGTYTVSAAKSGYASSQPSARASAQRPAVVLVGDDAAPESVTLALARGAAIGGQLVDDLGEPVANTTIFVEQLVEAAGSRSTRDRRSVQTNDAGEYRVGSLSEGNYVVSRQAPGTMQMVVNNGGALQVVISNGSTVVVQSQLPGRLNAPPPEMGPPRTFFPDAATLSEAEVVSLKAGEERATIDMIGPRSSLSMTDIVLGLNASGAARDPAVKATASIRGRVLGTTGPLAEAEVRLSGAAIRALPPVSTDTLGQYEFVDLPPGVYTISARKNRYLAREFGQDAASDRGTRLTLAEDERRDRVDITLPRTSAIAGQLTDEYGDPVEGVTIRIHQIRFLTGGRRLVDVPGASSARTDDQGRYRIFGLQPGSYIVAAYVGQLLLGQQSVADIPGYATTYFPGTPDPAGLRLVPVPPSQDLGGIDFSLSRIATATVSGVARNSAGEPITGGLQLVPSRRPGAVATTPVGARIEADGSFAFPNVPPGQYVIQAYRGRLKAPAEGEFVAVPVTVNGADIKGLLVQTSPGSTISGRITFDGGEPPASRNIDISPLPADPDLAPLDGNVARADIFNDWTFEMSGVSGPRRLRVLRTPRGWALKRILVNGADVTDTALPFGAKSQSLTEVEVVLTNRITEVSGTVLDDRGRPVPDARVLAYATDREQWYDRSRYVKIAGSSPEGVFELRDLPPGSYYVAAVARRRASEENGEWLNPDVLESLTPGASRITLAEGETVSVSPKLAGR